MAKLSEMSDQELGAKMRKILTEYQEHFGAGRLGDDAVPAHEIVNGLSRTNREARASGGMDDVEPRKSANGNNGNGGEETTLDEGGLGPVLNQNKGATDEASILRGLESRRQAQDRLSAKRALEDAAADASVNPAKAHQILTASRFDPAAFAATEQLIPGFDRLR